MSEGWQGPATKSQGGARGGGGLVMSSRTMILRFTSHKSVILLLTFDLGHALGKPAVGGSECTEV